MLYLTQNYTIPTYSYLQETVVITIIIPEEISEIYWHIFNVKKIHYLFTSLS